MNTFTNTTFNTPKHLVVLGRPVPDRMDLNQRNAFIKRLQNRVERIVRIPSSSFTAVPCVSERTSFGDVDFVLHSDFARPGWADEWAKNIFENCFYSRIEHSNTWVFEYSGYQINIHEGVPGDGYALTLEWLRYGGLGDLVSVMIQNLGLTIKDYKVALASEFSELEPLVLSAHSQAMTSLLNIGSEIFYYPNLTTKKEIFNIVRSCRYFNRAQYLSCETEQAERVNKNPLLRDFIAYLKETPSDYRESNFVGGSDTEKVWLLNLKKSYASIFKLKDSVEGDYKMVKASENKLKLVTSLLSTSENISEEEISQKVGLLKNKFKNEALFKRYLITSMPSTIQRDLKALIESQKPVVEKPVVVLEASALPPEEVPLEVKPKTLKQKTLDADKQSTKVSKSAKTAKPKKTLPRAVAPEALPADDNSFSLVA